MGIQKNQLDSRGGFTFDRKEAIGFTLVELMVVISIITILASIGLTIFSQAQQAARDGKRVSDMQEAQKALEQYYAINRAYPTPAANPADLQSVNVLNSYYQNLAPPNETQLSLVNNIQYRYWYCTGGSQYNICAALENCTGRCNVSAASPPNGCSQVGAPGSVTAARNLYCLKSLSN